MSIDAYNKFINTIFSRLSDYELDSIREINDITELEEIMETVIDRAYNIGNVKAIYHFVNAFATEYVYSNGLIYLDSKIMYKDKDSGERVHTLRQITLTTNYKEQSLVNIIIEIDKKAIQEFFVSSNLNNSIIPNEDKTIDFSTTSIYIGNRCGSVFETFTDIKSNSLLLERYMQYYPISEYEDSKKDLLRLCGCGTRYLEIIYHKDQPVFAQFSNKYKVEMADYNPNSSIDVKCIVNKINEEVEAIRVSINSLFDEHEEKEKNVQKRLVK